jgi:hypothetical protein
MRRDHLILIPLVIICFGLLISARGIFAAPPSQSLAPLPSPSARVASAAELDAAEAEWIQSAHAETYDAGQGANTTCARCKSPLNWEPDVQAAQAALDCGACKRVPGAPRPDLEQGVPVPESEWRNITCDICHEPVGDSYLTSLAFWNNELQQYEAAPDVTALCARCHEGRHGFQVVEEQEVSLAHTGWECTACHGAHGAPSACTDCHDPTQGAGSSDHLLHPQVNCTACHDAGELTIWLDTEPASRHYATYVPERLAHALTSWPSHNLQLKVRCERCHHPQDDQQGTVAQNTSCSACHPDGAVLFWCPKLPRDADPTVANSEREPEE